MNPDTYLYQSLSDLRTGPLLPASGKRPREAVAAQRPDQMPRIATDAGGNIAVCAGRLMAPGYGLASDTSPIERRAIPTRVT
jgi:hypothetical protein